MNYELGAIELQRTLVVLVFNRAVWFGSAQLDLSIKLSYSVKLTTSTQIPTWYIVSHCLDGHDDPF